MAHHDNPAFDFDDPDDLYLQDVDQDVHPERIQYLNERRRQKRLLIMRRRKIRDVANPYDVTYESFVKSYRLSQDLVMSLIRLIRPHIRVTTSPLALPLETKILAVLSFYASGSYQTPCGRQFDFAIAQPTLSTYIEEITDALNEDDVLSELIRFPANEHEVNLCIERNVALGGKISNVLGYTDGSLIKIMAPSVEENRQAFIGRKSFASMNAMFTCDRRMYIMNVNPRFPGSTFDSFIFQGSALRRKMVELYPQRRCHLVGDSGYACEPWMLVPFAREDRPEEDTPEFRYNAVHASDRNVIERCIGSLKGKYRALNDERVLHYHFVKVARMINAIVVVHNLGILGNVPEFMEDEHFVNDNVHGGAPEEDDLHDDIVHNVLAEGRAVRAAIMQELEQRRH